MSAFSNPNLNKLLKANHIKEIYVTGLDGASCVYDTATDAKELGYDVKVVQDAIISWRVVGSELWNVSASLYYKYGVKFITSDEF